MSALGFKASVESLECMLRHLHHPEGTSIGSDNCDLLKVSDFNGSQ